MHCNVPFILTWIYTYTQHNFFLISRKKCIVLFISLLSILHFRYKDGNGDGEDNDEDECPQMSRYITQYQDEFGAVLINDMENLHPDEDESEDDDLAPK